MKISVGIGTEAMRAKSKWDRTKAHPLCLGGAKILIFRRYWASRDGLDRLPRGARRNFRCVARRCFDARDEAADRLLVVDVIPAEVFDQVALFDERCGDHVTAEGRGENQMPDRHRR